MEHVVLFISSLLHVAATIFSIKVVSKYETQLIGLCWTKSFNPFKFEAVRLWTIILSLFVSFVFTLVNLQLLVAKTITISLQYQLLGIGAAILNINYLILLLLERRGVN